MPAGSLRPSRCGALALASAALVVLAAGSGVAGVNEWSSAGPPGGSITGIAVDPVDPSRIFVSTDGGGIFRSDDSGTTWEAANTGQNGLNLTGLAMAPSNADVLYSMSASSGVYRTADGGESWESKHSGLPSANQIRALAVHPSNPDIVYAATQGGVYKTISASATNPAWTLVGSSATGFDAAHLNIRAIAHHPDAPDTVFALSTANPTSDEQPLYVSTNNGGSWAQVNAGGTTTGPTGFPNTLVINPETPTTMYAGTFAGLWQTTDSGVSWTQIANSTTDGIHTNTINSIALERLDPGGRVYLATPFGLSWAVDPDGTPDPDPGDGDDWVLSNPINTALGVNTNAQVLALDPDDSNNVYAGTASFGMLKSDDEAATWAEANDGLVATNVDGLRVAPSAPRTVYASMSIRGSGVVKSTDAGATWARTKLARAARGIAVDPTDPDTVLVATDNGMYRTTDGGMATAWTLVNSGLPGSPPNLFTVAFDPANPDTAYAGLVSGGVYKTTNARAANAGDVSWTVFNSGLPATLIRGFAFDPDDTSTVYAATNSGVYKSTGGGSWVAKNGGGVLAGAINGIVVDPTDPDTVYAGRFGAAGVYKSTNGGDDWDVANSGLSDPNVTGLVMDPDDPATLYAATSGGPGPFRTTDGAGSWGEFRSGFDNPFANALASDAGNGAYLYAATSTGVFTRIVDDDPPTNPTLTPSHTPSVWSNDPSVDVGLSGAADPGESGVDGFDHQWDASGGSTLEPPSKDLEEDATTVSSGALADGNSHFFHLRTVDHAGRWSTVLHAGPFFIDTAPPSNVALSGTALNHTFQLKKTFPVSWSGDDALSGIAAFVLAKRINGGAPMVGPFRTDTGPEVVSGALGQTVCLDITAMDEAENVTVSDLRCTAIPFDDRQLKRSSGWTKKTGAGYFENTYSTTTRKGASLKRTLADADEIALVVTKCRGCGTLTVFWQNVKIAKVPLSATKTRKKRLVEVADFAAAEDGLLKLVVTSSGRPVHVDGLGVLRGP